MNCPFIWRYDFDITRIEPMEGYKKKRYWIDRYSFNAKTGWVSFQDAKEWLIYWKKKSVWEAKKSLSQAKKLKRAIRSHY